jgi:hypothetical protein
VGINMLPLLNIIAEFPNKDVSATVVDGGD